MTIHSHVCGACAESWSDDKETSACPSCGHVTKSCEQHPDYTPLIDVLHDALERARSGKGKERHADESQDFLQQPIFAIPRALDSGGEPLLFQAVKKIYESRRLPPEASRNELLDAIVYVAAAVILEGEDRCKL